MNKGFTLIETIIYIALLALIMGSGVIAGLYAVDSSQNGLANINTLAEAGFLLRKIDWALTGADNFDSSIPGTLSVNKNGFASNPIIIDYAADPLTRRGRARIKIGSAQPIELTGDRVNVTSLEFKNIPAVPPKPAGITASTTIDGKHFEITKYLRK